MDDSKEEFKIEVESIEQVPCDYCEGTGQKTRYNLKVPPSDCSWDENTQWTTTCGGYESKEAELIHEANAGRQAEAEANAENAELIAVIKALREALIRHDEWHKLQGDVECRLEDGDVVSFNQGTEYLDSLLFETTCDALSLASKYIK